jgi:hypothetical protein
VSGPAWRRVVGYMPAESGWWADIVGAHFPGPDGCSALLAEMRLPADVLPLGVVTIGHPAPDRRSGSLTRGRRPLDDVVHRERWRTH